MGKICKQLEKEISKKCAIVSIDTWIWADQRLNKLRYSLCKNHPWPTEGRKHNIWELDETQLESCVYTHIVKWHPTFPMKLSNLGEIGVGLWMTHEKCQFYFIAISFFPGGFT